MKLVNIAVQVKNTKNEQIPCPLQGNGFLFLPRAYGTSFKLIASSQQWIKLPKSTCRYERNRIMKINFKKMLAAVSSMWKLMQMAQMDVIRFARWRELGLLGISSHVNIRIRHRN